MPISITAARCCARSRTPVSGKPMALLRLPAVASRSLGPTAARGGGEWAQRAQRMGDGGQVAGQRGDAVGAYYRRDRATLARQFDVVMPVEALALERDE